MKTFFLIYRGAFGPALRAFGGLGQECRFHPSCSIYAESCLNKFGWRHGGNLALKRLLKCHPWSSHPTEDPVP